MTDVLTLDIDTDGTLDQALAELSAVPAGIERARRRALRKLMTWLKRQIYRAASRASGIPQKVYKSLLRISEQRQQAGGIRIWVGTNPISAHQLGTVRWTRRMRGARVGRRLFDGAWSWPQAHRTAGLVMAREGAERLPIHKETVEIDATVRAAINALQPQVNERFLRLMTQELNYELLREQGAL